MCDFIENTGAALAPWVAGLIADQTSLRVAILAICVATWAICAAVFGLLARVVPADIRRLRATMQARAEAATSVPAVPGARAPGVAGQGSAGVP